MQRVSIESRSLASAGYDPATRRLELEFRTGRRYEYYDVPPGVYSWLLRVPNKGQFVSRMISPCYAYRELSQAMAAPDLEQALRASLTARLGGTTDADS